MIWLFHFILDKQLQVCQSFHHRANLTRTFRTEYHPPTSGHLSRKSETVSCFSFVQNEVVNHHPIQSTTGRRKPLTKAANGCFPSTTRSRNTIPRNEGSSTQKSCCRPTPRRSTQTATPCGTPPRHKKSNGTPSLPGESCLPYRGKSPGHSTPT